VGALVRSDRRLTVRIFTSELNLNHTTFHQVLTEESTMKKLCAKFVPKNLAIEQKDNWKDMGLHLLEWKKGTEISRRMWLKVTKHGSLSTIQKKRQSKKWHTSASPRPKKARRRKSKIKSMLICFFDSEGIVHTEFVPQGHCLSVLLPWNSWKTKKKSCSRVTKHCWQLDTPSRQQPLVTRRSLWLNFWLKAAFLLFHSPHTHLIRVRATSYCSQN